jgi:Ca2+-binding RTX toxin-like protein
LKGLALLQGKVTLLPCSAGIPGGNNCVSRIPVARAVTNPEVFMPTSNITINGAFDTRQFFAPAGTAITTITGGAAMATVTLQSGLVLVYKGTGLGFTGATPTAGTVTGLDVLKADGSVLANLDLTQATWNFADITTGAPFTSYLATEHGVLDASALFPGGDSASFIQTGDQADFHTLLSGADTINAMGGDDTIVAFGRFLPNGVAAAGTVLDGGAGFDALRTNNTSVDLRLATILGIESLGLQNSASLHLSAAQFGAGKIATNAVLSVNTSEVLTIDQVAGRKLDVSLLQTVGSFAPRINLVGTAGNDVQIGNIATNDRLDGFDGNDRLNGNGGLDELFGGKGDDVLVAGNDATATFFAADTLSGGDGNDRLTGGNSASNLFGDAGNDRINGGTGFASLFGGDGEDWLQGGAAVVPTIVSGFTGGRIFGGNGNDTLLTGAIATTMQGEAGDDRYIVNHTGAVITEAVGGGNDRVVTTVNLDLTSAGEIEVIKVAGTAGLTVKGSATDNRITGGAGADMLAGGAGADALLGDAGADRLSGGTGADRLTGGAGSDVFVFATGFGRDVVTDYTDGQDKIDLTMLDAVTTYDQLAATQMHQVGQHVEIDGGNGDILVLRNVTLAMLDASDFLL